MRLNFRAHRKWQAWKEHAGMTKEDAMKKYVEEIEKLKAKYGA